MEHDSIVLSDMQVAVLLFFAERRDLPPRGGTRTTGALVTRGLLTRDVVSGRYQTTDLGRQLAADLDHEGDPQLHRT